MLTKVEVLAATGQVLSLPLADLETGYLIQDIDGLDPVKASLVTSRFGQLDGTRYQASRRENRNLVFDLKFQPAQAQTPVEILRRRLYAYFMPKSVVTLTFFVDDVAFAVISGRVESFESPKFTQEPEATISILCFDPDFYAPASVVFPGSTVSGITEAEVEYSGTVETGFLFRLMLDRNLNEFQIYNNTPLGETLIFEFIGELLSGDILEISTVGGSKYARVTRGGSEMSFLYGVSPMSNWINLFPGENKIRVQASGEPIPYEIIYKAKYGGL